MTLGNAATARVRLIVWCKACGHRVEPDPAEQAERYGAEAPVPEWREPLPSDATGCCNCCASSNNFPASAGVKMKSILPASAPVLFQAWATPRGMNAHVPGPPTVT